METDERTSAGPSIQARFDQLKAAANRLQSMGVALAADRRAAESAPTDPAAQVRLAAALFAAGRIDDAVKRYETALGLFQMGPEAHNGFGAVLAALERHEAATAQFERALALRPGYAEARLNLGRSLAALGRHGLAAEAFEALLAVAADHAAAHGYLSVSLEALNQPNDALRHALRAVEIDQNLPEAQFALGQILVVSGRLEGARVAFRRAISLSPRTPLYYRVYGQWFGFVADDPNFKALMAMAPEAQALQDSDRRQLYFALAQAFDDVGRRAESFDYLLRANELERRRVPYDEAEALGLLGALQQSFTCELLARLGGHGAKSAAPIFIVGMPRSGATLVEQILAAHPAVVAGGELGVLSDIVLTHAPHGPATLSPEILTRMGSQYLEQVATRIRVASGVASEASGALRITDKMPGNFALIGVIRLILPNARIVHVRRDPVDTCLSAFSKVFSQGQPFANDLGELGRYYRAYAALMAHWRRVLPDDAILEVDYEIMIADFEPQARRLLAYCDLPWTPACLEFHKVERAVRTASAAQVRRPLYDHAVGRGRSYGALLAPLLDALAQPLCEPSAGQSTGMG